MAFQRFLHNTSANEIVFTVEKSSLGQILVAQSPAGICTIWLGDNAQKLVEELKPRFPQARCSSDSQFQAVAERVSWLAQDPGQDFSLPLDIQGTAFQQKVWAALREIPAGKIQSYAHVALQIGAPGSARAVAQACGANCIALAIPCHRVVRGNGDISGYRWGVERKRELLRREAQGVL